MPDIPAVFVIVMHFTLMGYGGDVLPEGRRDRVAFISESECRKHIAVVRRSFAERALPIGADWITCEKLEVRK